MRTYVNQIEDSLIKEVLGDSYEEHKRIAKEFNELLEQKRAKELALAEMLSSRTVGKLEGVSLMYLDYKDSFYVAYDSVPKHANKKWWQFWK